MVWTASGFRGWPGAVFVLASLAGLSVLAPRGGVAAEDGPKIFLGVEVKPHEGTYLVLKDVNIRAKPQTNSKKIGSLKAGKKITVVGRAASAWFAVRAKGEDLGFVYDQVLLPMIDGTLDKDLTGRVKIGDATDCGYTIHFVSRSPVEGQLFLISDYDVFWDCQRGGNKIRFRTPMFMTEAPFQMGLKRVYQISVDVLDVDTDYDDIFSSIVLYDQDKNRVLFDSVSIQKFGQPPKLAKAGAKTVAEALLGAAKIAASSWKDDVWQAVGKGEP